MGNGMVKVVGGGGEQVRKVIRIRELGGVEEGQYHVFPWGTQRYVSSCS